MTHLHRLWFDLMEAISLAMSMLHIHRLGLDFICRRLIFYCQLLGTSSPLDTKECISLPIVTCDYAILIRFRVDSRPYVTIDDASGRSSLTSDSTNVGNIQGQ